jgi:hypothetical protein
MTPETQIESPRRPGRPKREEVMATERRRRKGGTFNKLEIPEAVKKQYPDMEFRWGRDVGARMQQLTQSDDWDKVPDVDPIHGGTSEAGNAFKMHLLMKPKAFLEADRQEKLDALKERERQAVAFPDAKTATATGAEQYAVPGNKI